MTESTKKAHANNNIYGAQLCIRKNNIANTMKLFNDRNGVGISCVKFVSLFAWIIDWGILPIFTTAQWP